MFDEIWQVLNSKNFSLAVTGFFIFGTIANIAGMIAFRGIEKDKNYIRRKEEIDEFYRDWLVLFIRNDIAGIYGLLYVIASILGAILCIMIVK